MHAPAHIYCLCIDKVYLTLAIKLANPLACILACGVGYDMMLIIWPETGSLLSVSQ